MGVVPGRSTRSLEVMRAVIATLMLLPAVASCAEEEACLGFVDKYYDKALSRELTREGIPHVVRPPDLICFSAKYKSKAEAADRRVNDNFRSVAMLLRDACEERALVAWAQSRTLSYDVHDVQNSDGRPGGRMFFLRSLSAEEVPINKDLLMNQAPKGAKCGA